jgi:hypothetical protein
MRSSTFVKVNQTKNVLSKIGEFFFGIEKVNVLELNGKKIISTIESDYLISIKEESRNR